MKDRLRNGIGAAIVFSATALGSGCAAPSEVRPSTDQTQLPTPGQEQIRLTWQSLPAKQRIQRLETHQYPQLGEFDARQELVQASAAFFVAETHVAMKPEELSSKVHVINRDDFSKKLQEQANGALSPQDLSQKLIDTPEIVMQDKQVYMNEDLLQSLFTQMRTTYPKLVERLGNNDLDVVITKNILFHAFSHVTETQQQVMFPAFSLHIPGVSGPINVDHVNGFRPIGTGQNGEPYYFNGSNEAATEFSARIIGTRSGLYLPFPSSYQTGVEQMQPQLAYAGISEDQYLAYYTGQQQLETLYDQWGASLKSPVQPTKKAAVLRLTEIGLKVSGFIK